MLKPGKIKRRGRVRRPNEYLKEDQKTGEPEGRKAGVSAVPVDYGVRKDQGIERAQTLVEYLRLSRLRTRYRNLDCLLISVIVHIAMLLVLSFFIREISYSPRDEIPVEWVKVDDPKAPSHERPKNIREKEFVFNPRLPEERTVRSLADRVSKSDAQSPRPSSIAKRLGAKPGRSALPQMFSAVETPISDADVVFSPRGTMVSGSSISKPGTSGISGTGMRGRGLGGLSTIESSAAIGDGFSGPDLSGIGGLGLVGPDPMDMIPAVTFGRQDKETVVFLLDISNSMEGNYNRSVFNREWFKKLKRAKRSIISSLYKLRPDEDKFYLVAFSSDFKVFHEEPAVVNESNLMEAAEFVQELHPATHQERTNLYGALMSALEVKPTRVILVSDGLPTEGVVSVRNILKGVKQKNNDARIYTFATNLGGKEEAQTLLSKMARDNSGRFSNDKMGLPRGIAVNSAGHIYVADTRVNVFDDAFHHIRSFGSHTIKLAIGPADNVHLLFYPDVRSSGFGALGVCRADGTQLKSFGAYGYEPRRVYEPWDIAADSEGRTYVVSTRANRISIFNSDGEFVRSFGSAGMRAFEVGPHDRGDSLTGGSRRTHIDREGVHSDQPGYFSRPMGVALDSHDNIYVLDSGNRRVQIFNPQIQFMEEFRIDGWGIAIAVDADGNYIHVLVGSGSTGGEKLYIYRPNGGTVEKFNVGAGTADIDVDAVGNIYALSFVYDEVSIFSRKGERIGSFSTMQ
jgi:hypothetical protein